MRGLALLGAMIAFASVVYADTYTYFFGQEKIDMPSASGPFARYWLFGLALSSIAIAVWWGAKRWGILRRWELLAKIAFFVLLALFLFTLAGFYFGYADTLAYFLGYRGTNEFSAGGRFMRDLALALLALGGIAMAAWRNREMSRQADAALNQSRANEEQAKVAQKQIENESRRIAGERFSDAVKMLAQNEGRKPAIAARIGGIYALQSLANNYISQYAVQVVKILVAYVRVNAQLTKIPRKDSGVNFLGEDVKAAFAILAQLLDRRDEFELSGNELDFSDCDFSRLCLDHRQVSGLRQYRWQRADLRGSDLHYADFGKAWMYGAQLQGANLRGTNLEGANLRNADFRGADLRIGITDKKFRFTSLRGAVLLFANMRGAALDGANLSDADCSYAEFQYTDLRGAKFSDKTILPHSLGRTVWHDSSELKDIESLSLNDDAEWDLRAYQNCPYALAGVLHNYMAIYDHDGIIAMSSRGLLKAARKLLVENKLPPGFSEIWRKRLEEVDPETGDHPDWRK